MTQPASEKLPPVGARKSFRHVVVAHEDARVRHSLIRALRADGHAVFEADNGNAVVSHLATSMLQDGMPPDVILAGPRLQGWSGTDIYEGIRHSEWDTWFMLVIDERDHDSLIRASRMRVRRLFRWPCELDELRTTILELGVDTHGGTPHSPGLSNDNGNTLL